VEFVSLEKWRQQFELNFFGQVRMTQLLLPLLRRRVKLRGKGSARIIFMSSIAGRLSQPILSPYCASKHAVEALADSLRLELCGQGIQVSLIEPGAIKSEIWDKGKSQVEEMPDDPQVQALYGELIKNVEAAAMKAKNDAIPAIYVSRAVEKCLAARRAPARVVVGRDAKLGAFARSYFPTRWVDGILSRMMGVPR
jgi:NAD(P)-dependent dehydrogenase (short-subunit alcohol dehydrogenase family)